MSEAIAVHRLENCEIVQLDNPEKWTLQGHSKAGERTGFWLHPEKIVLDAGLSTYRQPKAVYLTHKHIDHTGALPYILTARSGLRPVYMPEPVLRPLAALQKAIRWLSDGDEEPNTSSALQAQGCDPHLVEPGTTFKATKTLHVEVLAAYHDTQTVGYGFSRVKRKLKREYANFQGKKSEHFERRAPVSPRKFSNRSCAFSATRTFEILGTTTSGVSFLSLYASARGQEARHPRLTIQVSKISCPFSNRHQRSSGF